MSNDKPNRPEFGTALKSVRKMLARTTRSARLGLGLAPASKPPAPLPFGEAEITESGVVRGWVDNQDGVSEVQIALNGKLLASTSAARPHTIGGVVKDIGFARGIQSVWSVLGQGDRITVSYGGQVLPIVGHGAAWVCASGKASRSARVLARLDSDYVVNKYGRLGRGIRHNHAYQDWIFETFEALRSDIRDLLGYEAFPFYGSMLGAVREQNFIGHDNDFDMIYVSKHADPEQVKAEFQALCRALIDRGYWLRVKRAHTWIRQRGSRFKLDVFFGWFGEDGLFHVSNGYHHDPATCATARLDTLVPHQLAGREVMLPAGSEALLVQLYGPNWRIPDRGFLHRSPSLRLDRRYLLNVDQVHDLYWYQYYRSHTASPVSLFAAWTADRLPPGIAIVEIGCGAGGDAVFLAERGHRVVAVDRAVGAVALAEAHGRTVADRRLSVSVLDAADPDALQGLLRRASSEGPVAVYARFYLHAVTPAARTVLLDALAALPTGSRVAVEFRTTVDAPAKPLRSPTRWYLDPQTIRGALAQRGYVVEHDVVGRGLSPWLGKDPHLARMIAVKTADGPA
jgi:hypothetical protein